ncbi:MAG: hypothetical protein HOP29_04220 [Phycisphaerales bacterium]|nr:hypothetical protein [Phycisphaerales bacterium]
MTIGDVARTDGRYAAEAYYFMREGLDFAARSLHGPMTPAQFVVAQYMAAEKIDLQEVFARHARGVLDPTVAAAVDQADGPTELNRNISGVNLCWALRDFAHQRWGLLAGLVLKQWGIFRTDDFGAIVFALVTHGFMYKEAHDSIDDFRSVFDFRDAFDRSYKVLERMTD